LFFYRQAKASKDNYKKQFDFLIHMSLSEEFNEEDVSFFSKDLFLLINVLNNIDREYAQANPEFDRDFEHFKNLILKWNKKYKDLNAKHSEDGMQMKLKIAIKGKEFKEVIENAVKIGDLIKINGKEVILGKDISAYIPSNAKTIDLVYKDETEEENSLTLEKEPNGDIVVLYSSIDMLKKDTPEFWICAYYALKNMDSSISLKKFSSLFSFDTDLEASEGKGEGYLNRVRLFDKI
jgi:hypothetical protein